MPTNLNTPAININFFEVATATATATEPAREGYATLNPGIFYYTQPYYASNSIYPYYTSNLPYIDCSITNYLYCTNIVIIKYKGENLKIPKFNAKIDKRVKISIGLFAKDNFCEDFTNEEFNDALIEFSNSFVKKLLNDGLLFYHNDNGIYKMKKE